MWRRALAFLVDLVPLAILAGIENLAGIADREISGLINFLLLVSYFAGMNYCYGGTLGKRLVGLRVALPASPKVPLQLIIRALVKILCLVPPLAMVYGFMAIWREDGRSLADFAADSTVVEVPSYTPPKLAPQSERVIASFLILVSPCLFSIVLFISLFGWAVVEQLLFQQ